MITVNVLFFARLRESLETDRLIVTLDDGETAADLLTRLAGRGSAWAQLTEGPTVMIAVNQTMVRATTALQDQDEVALFPPVTGG
ncbi:MAG: molybdopterin converting factor subunit 1 [Oleiphilaceae bacterium]|nr:molybdopterin converting factor subunit 1 [Oleiphilaceae bacterium]